MAGVKKQSKKVSGGKNTALILFMVFFFLTSVGLGVWGYYGYADKDALKKAASTAKNSEEAFKKGEEFNLFLSTDVRLALGQTFTPDEMTIYKNNRDEILKADGGTFRMTKTPSGGEIGIKEERLKAAKAMVEQITADLEFDAGTNRYKATYKDNIKDLDAKVKKLEAALTTAQAELKTTTAKFADVLAKGEAFWADALSKIDKGNSTAIQKAQERYKEFQTALDRADQLFKEKDDLDKQRAEEVRKLGGQIKQLQVKLKEAEAAANSSIPSIAQGRSTEVHALSLDISKGKTLWDNPLGKITRLELENRQVYINMGSKVGLQPETTFMVFAAGWDGRAEKALKGTIECIRVLGEHSALCRITSLYDATGVEIALADPTRGRPQREAENALKEGDLLYNLVFGTRVAIVGEVNLTPYDTTNPSEQMRNLENFMALLKRQGVTVDSYIDLASGQIVGQISRRTNYLIRGHDLAEPRNGPPGDPKPDPKAEPKADPKEAKEKDAGAKAEPKEEPKAEPKGGAEPKAGEVAPDGERQKKVNEAIQAMRKEAIEKGLFIISPDNFVNVIGYRRPRSANNLEISGFRPTQPAASSVGFFQFASTDGSKGSTPEPVKAGDLKGKWSGKIGPAVGGGKLTIDFQADGGAAWTVQVGADGIAGFTNVGKRGNEFLAVVQGTPISMRFAEDGMSIQVTGGMLACTLTKE